MAALPEHAAVVVGVPVATPNVYAPPQLPQPVYDMPPPPAPPAVHHVQGMQQSGYEAAGWGVLPSPQRSFSAAAVPPSGVGGPAPSHAVHRQSASDGAYFSTVHRQLQRGGSDLPALATAAAAAAGHTLLPALHGAHHHATAWQQQGASPSRWHHQAPPHLPPVDSIGGGQACQPLAAPPVGGMQHLGGLPPLGPPRQHEHHLY